ncbi:MAG: hypothetical protein KDD48_00430 [Bdellovibrionales bacterium]|nr:hypothetical protein [Bdellovibrionales bacterium]
MIYALEKKLKCCTDGTLYLVSCILLSVLMACRDDRPLEFTVGATEDFKTHFFMYEGPGKSTGFPSETNLHIEVSNVGTEATTVFQEMKELKVKFKVETEVPGFTGTSFDLPEIHAPMTTQLYQGDVIAFLVVNCETPESAFREGPFQNVNIDRQSKYLWLRAPCKIIDEKTNKSVTVFDLGVQIRIDSTKDEAFYELFAVKTGLSPNPQTIIGHASEQELKN